MQVPNLTPRCSVIICCYNQGEFIEEAIQSVLNQTYKNIETIIVDNGSTDQSPLIIQKYIKSQNIKVLLHKNNLAVTQRLNEAIALSSGEFISILYADDYYLPSLIEEQVNCFKKLDSTFGIVYTPCFRLNHYTKETWIPPYQKLQGEVFLDILKNYFTSGYICPISPMVRKICFKEFPFWEDLFQEAESVYIRIALKYKFFLLDTPLAVMRDHANNLGKALIPNHDNFMVILNKLESLPAFPKEHKRELNNLRSYANRNHGWQSLRHIIDKKWGRDRLFESLQWNPMMLISWKIWIGFALSFLPNKTLARINSLK